MRVAGAALAKQVIRYLNYRSDGRSTTRLFLSGYPREVIEEACRSLVEQAARIDSENIDLGRDLHVAVALIQSPDETPAGLLTERGYQIGVSPDYPVALRNRRGNVIIACPPELIDLCHESIKTNSFQHFADNQKFGSASQLLREIARHLSDDEERSKGYAVVLKEVHRRERDQRGDIGESAVFSRIEQLVEAERGSEEGPDWRLLGLLPQIQLENALAETSSRAAKVSSAVGINLKFQSSLSEGISREQHKYVGRFVDSDGYEALHKYLATCSFRLDVDDLAWRVEWPSDLTIERLRPSAPAPMRVTSLRLRGNSDVLGLQLVEDHLEIRWRLRPSGDGLSGRTLIGDAIEHEIEDLGSGRLNLENLELEPGSHKVEIFADDRELSGKASAPFFVAGDEPVLLVTIDGQLPSSDLYRVAENESFRLRWAVVPPAEPSQFAIRVIAGTEDGTSDEALPGHQDFRDFVDGIEAPIEVRVEGRDESGAVILERGVRIDPIREKRTTAVPTVAQALLNVAAASAPDSARPRGSATVERMDDGYDVRIEGTEVSRSFRPKRTDLLEVVEGCFLDRTDDPRPLALVRMLRDRTYRWLPAIVDWPDGDWPDGNPTPVPSEIWDAFLSSRKLALKRLKQLAGSGLARMTDMEDEIEKYVVAYRNTLSSLLQREERIDPARALICLIDCLLIETEPTIVDESSEPPVVPPPADTAAVLVSPTHPLRLAWMLQFERAITELLENSEPWSHETLLAYDSRSFPACLVDWRLEHFHAASSAAGGRWGVLLGEGTSEIDPLIPSALARQLNVDSPPETVATTPEQLAAGVVQFHELHPQRDVLRLSYANPGSGEMVLQSLEKLVPANGFGERRGELAKRTADRCRYDVNLVDLFTDRPNWKTGSAFGEYATGDDPDQDLVDRVTFSVERLPLSDFGTSEITESHVFFGSNIFALQGESVPIPQQAPPPIAHGLIAPSRRFFEPGTPTRIVAHTLVPKPGDWGQPQEDDVVSAMHGAAFGLQCAAAATRDRPQASQTQGRALVAEVDQQMSSVIDRMNSLSEWVYLIDSHVDVEYFDQPALEDRYVIDYVPRILTGSGSGRRHNYVISTTKDAVLRSVINRFLHAVYAHEDVPESAAGLLSKSLNRLSGRLLLQMIHNPSRAKGAVGMGLLQLLIQSLGLLRPSPPDSMRALIPIDDYAADWDREFSSLRGEGAKDRADVLDILIETADQGVHLTFQVIEIKNVRRSYSAAELRQGPYSQIEHSARQLEALYGFGNATRRGDQAAKNVELARLIDFHVRRTAMHEVGNDQAALRKTAEFRAAVLRAISTGDYESDWRRASDGTPSNGLVVHFNADQSYEGAAREPEVIKGDDGVGLYIPLGRGDIARLLAKQIPEGIEERPYWFSGAVRPDLAPEVEVPIEPRGDENGEVVEGPSELAPRARSIRRLRWERVSGSTLAPVARCGRAGHATTTGREHRIHGTP